MRVLIVDDHPLYREGLKALLWGLQPHLEVVDAPTVAAALLLAADAPPVDLVLLDMNLPGANRLEALQQVREAFDGAAVVAISGDEDPAFIVRVIEAGAAGYIPKTTDPAVTIHALQLVLARGVYVPAAAIHQMAAGAPAPAPNPLPTLSERQWAVLQRLLQGKANKVIARELDIAEGTVKAHLWAIYQALGVHTRMEAMRRSHEVGLLGPAPQPVP